ncbi:hypothetical protein [Dyadobacter sp. 32]|uniref:hypothetical protein n=1 Tax=Dyadobacter sp. 32 TaxID=538966 RepID=UPI0011EBF044
MKNTNNFILTCIALNLPVLLFLYLQADWHSKWYYDLFAKDEFHTYFLGASFIEFGLLAHWLKENQQYWFGLFEVTFAFFLFFLSIFAKGQAEIIACIISFIAGIQAFARGLSNIREGSDKRWFMSDSMHWLINKILKNFK